MNYFTDGTAKDLFIATKQNNEQILLSQAVQLEQCYERLFSPLGSHMLNQKTAEGLTDGETALLDTWMRKFIQTYATEKPEDQLPLQTIRNRMPHTKLTIEQNRQLDLILMWIVGDEYDKVMEGDLAALTSDALTGQHTTTALEASLGAENWGIFESR